MRSTSAKKAPKKKSALKALLIIIVILAIAVAGGGAYTLGLRPAEPGNEDPVVVEIPSGSGASYIVELLDEAGLVRNKFWAKVNARIGGYDSLQSNTYVFNKGMAFNSIMNAINTGDFSYISTDSIEVRDGARLEQVAESASGHLPFSADEIFAKWNDKDYVGTLIEKYWFLTDEILSDDVMYPLEGYLYADTYTVTTGNSTIEGFTEMCLDRMKEALDERRSEIEASEFTVHQFLTLTSIVTKEARAEDQAGVAGVFMNRLDQGMALGSDVTVNYIFGEDRVDLYQSQLDSDSPYNTRKFAGLPPGPICQVVSDAMDATLNYTSSEDLYFFADADGIVHFFKSFEDFEQGKEDIGLLHDDTED